ncbi:MAG: glycosyltransferase family 39 protein [Chloroflexi bacterium]|nr:glycosyltransferase family 39 protein [Chloroflexota bacterium]
MKSAPWQVLGILLGGFLLRVIQLDARPVWYDEAFAVLYAEKSFAQMWYGTVTQVQGAAADVHPLFFYGLLHGWMNAVGQSAFAVRFMSVAFGVGTVAVMYRLTREWFEQTRGASLALLAAAIVACAPFHLAYSQEARMYAQLGFFAALFVLAYVMIEKKRGRAWWLLFVLSGAAMLYSHNLAVFFGLTLGVVIVVRARQSRNLQSLGPFVIAGAAMLLLWLPWLLLLPSQMGKIQQAYWVAQPDVLTLLQTLLTFTADFDNARFPPLLLPFALGVAVLLFVLLMFELMRGGWRDARIGFFAVMAGAPPLLIFLVSLWRPVYLTRTLMPSFLMLAVLVAWLLTRLPRVLRRAVMVVLALVTIATYAFYYPYADFPRPPFREGVAFLDAHVLPGDAIVHDNKMTYFPMHYYAHGDGLPQAFIADPAGGGSDTLAYPTQEALDLFATNLENATGSHPRVWFVIFRQAREESAHTGNLEWMRAHYHLAQEMTFHDLELYLFEK